MVVQPITANGKILFYVNDDELNKILKITHDSIGHGGYDRMISELPRKYKNITLCDVEIFIYLCDHVNRNKKALKKE